MSIAPRRPKHLKLSGHKPVALPVVWLGQSVRTTIVTRRYPDFAKNSWMVSLGDAVHRPRLIEKVFQGDIRSRIAVTGPLMLDSGGFTMMMKSQTLSLETIASTYSTSEADLCIALDLPPLGSDGAATRRRKYRKAAENLKHLVEVVGAKRIVPVVHGTTRGEVESNCDLISGLAGSPAMVCVGGMVPLLRRSGRPSVGRDNAIAWLTTVLSATRAAFPRAVIHLLGAGAPQSVAMAIACGADSTDSIAWRRAAGFGTIYLPGTGERFLAPRGRSRANSRPMLDAAERELLAACRCPACREFPVFEERTKALQDCYLARAAHNATIVLSGTERSSL